MVFNSVIDKLEKHHSLTIVSPNKFSCTGTWIDTSLVTRNFENYMAQKLSYISKTEVQPFSVTGYMEMSKMIVKQIPFVPKKNYDLIMVEAFMESPLVLAHLYNNTPIIQISSGFATTSNLERFGVPEQDSILGGTKAQLRQLRKQETKLIRKKFGSDVPDILELRQRVSSLMLGATHRLDSNRMVPPGIVYFGGVHIRKPKPTKITADVLVSTGSMINSETIFSEICRLASQLNKITFLVKYSGDAKCLWKNFISKKWIDQRNILASGKVKVFVTHGGLLSVMEAISSGVPMVVLPMMGDQFMLGKKVSQLRIGTVVGSVSELGSAILRVMSNPITAKKSTEASVEFNNRPFVDIRKWVEYIGTNEAALEIDVENSSLSKF